MAKQTEKLQVVSLSEIILEPAKEVNWVVKDMICRPGLYILAGPPKSQKSWFDLDLSTKIGKGEDFLGFPTQKGGVLYCALEDTPSRIQARTWKLLDEFEGDVYFTVSSSKVNEGLLEQLEMYLKEHPDCILIIIDTLQMVRSGTSDYKYSADYDVLSAIKKFADTHNIAILVVHHTRKMHDVDVFNNVSGTNAITGSADGMLVLDRVNRADGSAILSITGRDVAYCELKLKFHDFHWELIERTSQEELEERNIPDEVLKAIEFMRHYNGVFEGSTTDLYNKIGITDITPIAFGKRLAQHKPFMEGRGVNFSRRRTNQSAVVRLEFVNNTNEREDKDV